MWLSFEHCVYIQATPFVYLIYIWSFKVYNASLWFWGFNISSNTEKKGKERPHYSGKRQIYGESEIVSGESYILWKETVRNT